MADFEDLTAGLDDDQKEIVLARLTETEKKIYEMLSTIIRTPKSALNVEQKRFLQARRSYLSDAQQADYKDVLAEKLPRPDGEPNEEEEQLEEMARKDLEAMAEQLEIDPKDVKKAKTNKALQDLIAKKQKELEDAAKE